MKKNQKNPGLPKVFLSQVGDRLLKFSWSEADSWLEEMLAENLAEERPAGSRAECALELQRQGSHFQLNGRYRLELEPVCSRCGKDFASHLSGSFQMLLMPQPQVEVSDKNSTHHRGVGGAGGAAHKGRPGKDEEEEEETEWGASDDLLVEDDIGTSFFSTDEVDVSRYLMENILLERPMNYLCRKDCPGLCSQCGADLSVSRCGCTQEKSDPRWEVLKKVKLP